MTGLNHSSTSVALMTENAGQLRSWVHLIPIGTFSGIDGRGPYSLEDPEAVIQASQKYAGSRKMVIDYEHQTDKSRLNGKPAPAAGWVVGLQVRDDGIWGLVEWTETAAAHIAKREYRYVSPVFNHTKAGEITRLLNVALTNSPNLDQLIALNRAEETMNTDEQAGRLSEVAKLLGLPDNADQTMIADRLKQLKTLLSDIQDSKISANIAEPDPAKFVPIGEYKRAISEVNKLRSGVSRHKAEEHVSRSINEGKIPPFMKDWAVSLCTSNVSAYDEFVSGVGSSFTQLFETSAASAMPPKHLGSSSLSDDELAVCRNMGLTEEQYLSAQKSSQRNME